MKPLVVGYEDLYKTEWKAFVYIESLNNRAIGQVQAFISFYLRAPCHSVYLFVCPTQVPIGTLLWSYQVVQTCILTAVYSIGLGLYPCESVKIKKYKNCILANTNGVSFVERFALVLNVLKRSVTKKKALLFIHRQSMHTRILHIFFELFDSLQPSSCKILNSKEMHHQINIKSSIIESCQN